MELAPCCERRELIWKQSRVGDRWADLYVCASCAHIHRMESWLAPVQYPGFDHCVNCGGAFVDTKCEKCGYTLEKGKELHDGLAALHPDRDYLQGALVASELGRHVLALKLASAAVRWGGGDPTVPRTIRLQALEALGQLDRALDEAYDWARLGAPSVLWGVIADLEGAAGNIDGAVQALAHGLQAEPGNLSMWVDYAELLVHLGDRPTALNAAARALGDAEFRPRCLQVITDVAEGYFDEKLWFDCEQAMETAGEHQERNVALAWLNARFALEQDDEARATTWLEKVLALDPNHAEAQLALEKLRPNKRRSWLPWG